MPTLEEILNEGLGVADGKQGTEKTASAVQETDEIEKLALELGLADAAPTAEPQQTKEAEMSLSKIYENLFPDDAALDKVASAGSPTQTELEKQAAYEEALGARAYDYFADRVNARIEKLAEASMSEDSTPVQALPNNKKG